MIKVIDVVIICFLLNIETEATNTNPSASLTCSVSSSSCTTEPHNNDIKELFQKIEANSESIYELKNLLRNASFANENTVISSSSPPTSCQDIQQNMASGMYLIASAASGNTQYVYCYMDTLCHSDGGWTRLANLNMTDPTENCPGGLRLYDVNGVRACGRPVSGSSCHSIQYPSHGVQYSQICGRAKGYQYCSPDAVQSTTGHNDINSHYVDGVSVTRGSPRKHIWTFMAGLNEDNSYQGTYTCPCQIGSRQASNVPSFIGSDYFCESGNPGPTFSAKLYADDPLWDGKKCRGLEEPCCKGNLPWFHKSLNVSTSDYIEVRVCGDQDTGDEDVAIEQLEIYVK